MLLMITKTIVDTRRVRYRGITAATAYGRRSSHVGITPVVIGWNTTANIIIQPFSAIKIASMTRVIIQMNIISYQILANSIKTIPSGTLYNCINKIVLWQQFEQKACNNYNSSNPNKQKGVQAENIHSSIFSNLHLLFHISHLHKFLQTILSLTSFSKLNQLFSNIFNIKSIVGQSHKGERNAALRS